MANNDEAGGSSGGRGRQYIWPCNIWEPIAEELARHGLLVPPDSRLPSRWPMSAGGLAVPPIPKFGTPKLELLIRWRWMALPDELKADPRYSSDNQYQWLSILAAKRRRDIGRYAGGDPKAPAKNNCEGRWNFWEGRTIEEVLDAVRAGRNVARRTAAPRVGTPCTT